MIQVVNDRIIVSLADNGTASGGSKMTSRMVAVDADGNVISEFDAFESGGEDIESLMLQ